MPTSNATLSNPAALRGLSSNGEALSTQRPPAQEERLEALTDEVCDIVDNPVDAWAVVATLESIGWRDVDAKKTFGYDDLFPLGEEIYGRCKARTADAPAEHVFANSETPSTQLGRFIRHYSRGLLFALPMAGQIAAILLLNYSLWAWLYFSEAEATVISIGTIFSFVVTGGFIQSIGREGTHRLSNDQEHLALKAIYRLVGLGSLTVVLVAVAVFVLNVIFPFYPLDLMAVSMMYYILLAELWLFLSVLYVANHLLMILALTLLGIVPVYLVAEYTTWSIYAAHGIGLLTTVLLAAGYGYVLLRHRAKRRLESEGPSRSRLPHRAITLDSLRPYFLYGTLYFVFLFIDRVVAWSVPVGGEPPPYIIWFRTSYELGMDWALLSLLLTLALLEYTIHHFSHRLIPSQQATHGLKPENFNDDFYQMYQRQLWSLLGLGIVSIAATYLVVVWAAEVNLVPRIDTFFANPETTFVFFGASFAYLLIAVGLSNALFFFTMNRPGFVLRSLTPALVANLIVGLLASRWFGFEYAVLGLIIGASIFAGLSMRYARRFFARLDYYYYAAY